MAQIAHRRPNPVEFDGDNECQGRRVKGEMEKPRWDYRGSPGEVQRLLTVLIGEMKRTDIQEALALRHEEYFRQAYLTPALTAGMIEMTIPGKPTSSKRRYLPTLKGRNLAAKLEREISGK